MAKLFSQRTSHQPDIYRYDFPVEARRRFLFTLKGISQQISHGFDLEELFNEVQDFLLQKYGSLYRPIYDAARLHHDALINHFLCCDVAMAMDFIEICFRTRSGCGRQKGVNAINELFQEEAIGYELTNWREIETGESSNLFGLNKIGGRRIQIEYPQIVRKDEEFTHEEIIRPCLEALGNPKLKVANAEMIAAFQGYRTGKYADALTSCGSAFESVLKTICSHFGWDYDPDKDTCSKLVGICREKNLFPPFYAPILEATGTIRNKLGDAHGRGPAPMYSASKEHVNHMIQMTSAHIIFLVSLAKL